MARPITPTPVLSGEDAKRFVAAAQNQQPFTPPKVDNERFIELIKQDLTKKREQKYL